MGRRICFISSRPGYILDGQSFKMDWANLRLIAQLKETYQADLSVALFSDPEESAKYDSSLSVQRVYGLPFPFSHPGGIRNVFRIYSCIEAIQKENDLLVVQLPMIGFPALLTIKKPVVFHLCANVLTASKNPVKYRGIRKLLAGGFASFMHAIHNRLFGRKNSVVLANGSELTALYSAFDTVKVLSSSLVKQDIVSVGQNRADRKTTNILFVGRPSLEKGFDVLVEALLLFRPDFQLSVVGFTAGEFKGMLPQLFEKSRPIHSKISFKGHFSWSDEFKSIIRNQDVLTVPSRSEGTPRVILEGLSQGVPVIGSRTGGIPDLIIDNETGLLTEVGDVEGLGAAIHKITTDHRLRERIVENGLSFARSNTVEHFASHFIKSIEQLTNE